MVMEYEVVIGLEVHVELLTKTKLFCACPNRFTAEANSHTCEVCLGFPGALPLLNREAVQKALTASLALNCEIALHSYFDRKNYFYPDIPKGYQISQYFIPLGSNGFLEIEDDGRPPKRIRIGGCTWKKMPASWSMAGLAIQPSITTGRRAADRNRQRAGSALPGESRRYLEQLKSILQYAEVSDCKDGRGQPALRRRRIAASQGEHRFRQQGRTEEHELL